MCKMWVAQKSIPFFTNGSINDTLTSLWYLHNQSHMRNKTFPRSICNHLVEPEHHSIWLFRQIHTFPFVVLHDTQIDISSHIHRYQWRSNIFCPSYIERFQHFPRLTTYLWWSLMNSCIILNRKKHSISI